MTSSHKLRHLVVVLGDQLDGQSAAFDGFDNARDAILQMEVKEEASYIPQHRRRLVLFFAAMRHFRDEQRAQRSPGHLQFAGGPRERRQSRSRAATPYAAVEPEQIIVLEPGDWRVRAQLADPALPIEFRADRHFLCSRDAFSEFADRSSEPGHGDLLSLHAPATWHPDRGRWRPDGRQAEFRQRKPRIIRP